MSGQTIHIVKSHALMLTRIVLSLISSCGSWDLLVHSGCDAQTSVATLNRRSCKTRFFECCLFEEYLGFEFLCASNNNKMGINAAV